MSLKISEDDEWSITTITHHFGAVAQVTKSARLSSGRLREQRPSAPPFFFGYEEERNPPGLGPGDTRSITEVPDHF